MVAVTKKRARDYIEYWLFAAVGHTVFTTEIRKVYMLFPGPRVREAHGLRVSAPRRLVRGLSFLRTRLLSPADR
jgi:hypothetical protein